MSIQLSTLFINKIQHLDWYTTAYVETDIDILGDNIYLAGATYDLLITETNLSDFDSHYTGYTLSSNSDFIEFSLEENWFYVIFAGETYTDNSTFTILDDVPIGQEITIYIEPSWMDCNSDSCVDCVIGCLECISGGESEISFTIAYDGLLGDINGDEDVNVLDVVMLVNIVLDLGYIESGDLNFDDQINVLDIVMLVNLILSE